MGERERRLAESTKLRLIGRQKTSSATFSRENQLILSGERPTLGALDD
jgi:hypothetical protein